MQHTTANIGIKFVLDAQLVDQMKMLPTVVGQMARYGQTFFIISMLLSWLSSGVSATNDDNKDRR